MSEHTADNDAPSVVYVQTGHNTWGKVFTTLEGAKADCDLYLELAWPKATVHAESGTDADGWFSWGEPPTQWHRYFGEPDRASDRPQEIRALPLHDSRVTPSAVGDAS